jgi:hypothetical protein
MKNTLLWALTSVSVLASPPAFAQDRETDPSKVDGTGAVPAVPETPVAPVPTAVPPPPSETLPPLETKPGKAGKAGKKNKAGKDGKDGKDWKEGQDGPEVKEGKDSVEFKGRVFALAQHADERIDYGQGPLESRVFSLGIPSARFGIKVRIHDGVTLVIEADFAGKASIKDGFLQAKGEHWVVRAGRFKMPTSAFTLESPWVLPRAQRGGLDDLLSDHMLLFGRREGVMGRVEGGGYWDPALTVGAFQSVGWGQLDGENIAMGSPKDLTSVARLSIKPGGTEVALVGQRRVTLQAESKSFGSGGVDVTSELEGELYAMRLWAEGYAGKSWYRQDEAFANAGVAAVNDAVTFFEARILAAFRRGGIEKGDRYAELFFSGGLLDPDTTVTQDHFLEVSGGLNVGHWQKTRLTLEIEHGRTAKNFPVSYFRTFGLPVLLRRTAALLQVGAAF